MYTKGTTLSFASFILDKLLNRQAPLLDFGACFQLIPIKEEQIHESTWEVNTQYKMTNDNSVTIHVDVVVYRHQLQDGYTTQFRLDKMGSYYPTYLGILDDLFKKHLQQAEQERLGEEVDENSVSIRVYLCCLNSVYRHHTQCHTQFFVS